MKKNWIKSKTLWANLAILAAGVLTLLAGELNAGASLTVAGVANMVLRVVTKTELKW